MCALLLLTCFSICIPAALLRRRSSAVPAAGLRRRLVVASPFDREFDVAEIKLAEATAVDRVVLCESDRTQAGYPRVHRLHRLRGDVERCTATCPGNMRGKKLGWNCEGSPRDAALRQACANEPDDTLVFLSDIDEIISADTYERVRQSPPVRGTAFTFKETMSVHIYGFFWQQPNVEYSTARVADCATWRAGVRQHTPYEGAHSGWHCSYCFPVDEYLSKIHSMTKADGPLSLSDYYWPQETLWSLRQHGIPLNSNVPLEFRSVPLPSAAAQFPYLCNNTQLDNLAPPSHPF